MVKLYIPYGTLKSFAGPKQLTIHWFRLGRTEPIAPYPQLIMDYKQLAGEKRATAEALVDELFTEEEFQALRTYLYQEKGEDVRTGILVAPVSTGKQDIEARLGLVRPFAACVEGQGGGFCKLSEYADYSLPFEVWGYYTAPARFLLPTSAGAAIK